MKTTISNDLTPSSSITRDFPARTIIINRETRKIDIIEKKTGGMSYPTCISSVARETAGSLEECYKLGPVFGLLSNLFETNALKGSDGDMDEYQQLGVATMLRILRDWIEEKKADDYANLDILAALESMEQEPVQ